MARSSALRVSPAPPARPVAGPGAPALARPDAPPRWMTRLGPRRARRLRNLLGAVAVLAAGYLFLAGPEGLLARLRLERAIRAARAEGAALRARREALAARVAALRSVPAGTLGEEEERIAREVLGYRRPGERVLGGP